MEHCSNRAHGNCTSPAFGSCAPTVASRASVEAGGSTTKGTVLATAAAARKLFENRQGTAVREHTLRGLKTFCTAARHLSFKRAAEELCISPSAVSHQVKALEALFGVALFERLTREIALTDDGASLFARVDPLLKEIDRAADQFVERAQSRCRAGSHLSGQHVRRCQSGRARARRRARSAVSLGPGSERGSGLFLLGSVSKRAKRVPKRGTQSSSRLSMYS